ncbi:MAG TPA: VOC family protein [Propionibacteriaceae bacterium]|nr:VOC family protein [Propionibacteriaceae bacterium]
MQKIVPNIWFDHNAAEAVDFYVSAFPDARITATQYYPSEGLADFQASYAGLPLMVDFEIAGYRLMAINAGPEFPVNSSVSFMLNFDPSVDPQARENLDALWAALSEGGRHHMALGEYPFSPRYGWVEDRYGVHWQLILTNPEGEPRPFIIPSLMFGHTAQNRASEAMDYYTSVFGGHVGMVAPYPEQHGPAAPGSVQFGEFELLGQWFAAMDSAVQQDASFNCGVSLMVECHGQVELDRLWAALSAVPEAEQCGWCADKFGLSWQLVPDNLGELMTKPGAFTALMNMKKIEIADFG